MQPTDTFFTVAGLLSVGLAVVVCTGLILSSAWHLIAVAERRLRGAPAQFDIWVGARLIAIVVAIGIAALVQVWSQGDSGPVASFALQAAEYVCLFVIFCAPLLLVLFKLRIVDMEKPENQTGHKRTLLAARNLFYVLGLPGVMTLFVLGGYVAEGGLPALKAVTRPGYETASLNYYPLPKPTACSTFLHTAGPVTLPLVGGAGRSPDHIAYTSEFWLDTMVNVLTVSVFDLTGCYLRRVDYNRENPRMIAAVATFNMILVFVVSTIVYSVFRHKVRLGVKRAVDSSATP